MSDLIITNLSREFPTAEGSLTILKNVNLSMSRGDALVITGPSGSGKSTLLYLVGTLDTPTSGQLSILEQDPARLDTSALASFRQKHIGFVFQDHHLLPQLTVLENVLLPLLAGTGTNEASELRAKQLLERVGLGHRLDHRPAMISGGERQRVALCRALINQPEILLADEPTGNLDQQTAEGIGTLLLELSQEQQTLLICVTHSTELAARFPMQHELRDGQLVDLNQKVGTKS